MGFINIGELFEEIDSICMIQDCDEIKCKDCLIGKIIDLAEKQTLQYKAIKQINCPDGEIIIIERKYKGD